MARKSILKAVSSAIRAGIPRKLVGAIAAKAGIPTRAKHGAAVDLLNAAAKKKLKPAKKVVEEDADDLEDEDEEIAFDLEDEIEGEKEDAAKRKRKAKKTAAAAKPDKTPSYDPTEIGDAGDSEEEVDEEVERIKKVFEDMRVLPKKQDVPGEENERAKPVEDDGVHPVSPFGDFVKKKPIPDPKRKNRTPSDAIADESAAMAMYKAGAQAAGVPLEKFLTSVRAVPTTLEPPPSRSSRDSDAKFMAELRAAEKRVHENIKAGAKR